MNAGPLTQAIQRLNSNPYNLTKDECIQVIRELRDEIIAAAGAEHMEAFNGQGWRKECADTDALLSHLGLATDACRTDGGWLNLPRVKSLLDARSSSLPPAPKPWPELLPLLNDYAMAMTDAALHQSASKGDIAKTQAMKALRRLRASIYGDEKKYGEVQQ